jgi:hypothetical protein
VERHSNTLTARFVRRRKGYKEAFLAEERFDSSQLHTHTSLLHTKKSLPKHFTNMDSFINKAKDFANSAQGQSLESKFGGGNSNNQSGQQGGQGGYGGNSGSDDYSSGNQSGGGGVS